MRESELQTDPLPHAPPLFGHFLRAQVPHAEILALDLTAARKAEGVTMVLDFQGLGDLGRTHAPLATRLTSAKKAVRPPDWPLLARDHVRYQGEPVALVLAETAELARAAADLVALDLIELPEVRQLVAGGDDIHPDIPGNLAFEFDFGPAEATAEALSRAVHRAQINVSHNRELLAPPQAEGAQVWFDAGRLRLRLQGAGVWTTAELLAEALGLSPDAVEILNPDLGAYARSQSVLPEYLCLALAAKATARPVHWQNDVQAIDREDRDTLVRAEIGFDDAYRMTALRVNLMSNLGAYASETGQLIQTEHFAQAMTGDYDIGLATLGAMGVFTNTPPLTGYSGAGRAEAVLTLERLIDTAAVQLGLDPVDLRQRNLCHAPQAPKTLDVADTGQALVGTGHACQPVAALQAQMTTRLVLAEGGTAVLSLGMEDQHGKSAAILAEATGIDPSAITVLSKGGFGAAEGQEQAVRTAVDRLISGLTLFLQQDVGVKEVRFADHDFTATGSNMRLSLEEAAEWAREKGRESLLDISVTVGEDPRPHLHRAQVAVDASTGQLTLLTYWPETSRALAESVLAHLSLRRIKGNRSDPALMLPNLHEIPGVNAAEALAAASAISNAAFDALARKGVRQVDLPLTPNRVLNWLKEAGTVAH